MVKVALSIILGLGVLGIVFALRPAVYGQAPSTIDDSWRAFRYFNRVALFGLAYIVAWVSTILICNLLPESAAQAFKQSPELAQAILLLACPVPLAVMFYRALARLSRRFSGER